jgi:hypothetical protein
MLPAAPNPPSTIAATPPLQPIPKSCVYSRGRTFFLPAFDAALQTRVSVLSHWTECNGKAEHVG